MILYTRDTSLAWAKKWVVCTLGYEVSHLSLSSSKVVTGELHSCMRNPGQLSPDLKGWSFAKWWGGCWVTQLNTKLNPHIFKHLKDKTLDLVLWTKGKPKPRENEVRWFFSSLAKKNIKWLNWVEMHFEERHESWKKPSIKSFKSEIFIKKLGALQSTTERATQH